MHLISISLYIQNGGMKTSFINNILNSQPFLIKFALKLFVCKYLSFQKHLLLDLRFPCPSDVVFIMLINVSVGILTFMSMVNFVLS